MKYTIADTGEYIRADLFERQNAEETESFLKAIGVERRKHQRKGVLICVHAPRAFFHVEKYHASRFLETLAGLKDVRLAPSAMKPPPCGGFSMREPAAQP